MKTIKLFHTEDGCRVELNEDAGFIYCDIFDQQGDHSIRQKQNANKWYEYLREAEINGGE